MPGKARVHELAKEFGVDSNVVLARLKEMGEFVKSASSTIEADVARRLREYLSTGLRPGPAPDRRPFRSERPRLPSPPPVPFKRKPREPYRGEPVSDFTRRILDEHVVRPADMEHRPRGAKYWKNEVQQAQRLSNEWARLFLEMPVDDIMMWIKSGVVTKPEDAAALHKAGVRPHEIDWNYEDRGNGTLAARLDTGRWTVEQVINEVMGRRQRAS